MFFFLFPFQTPKYIPQYQWWPYPTYLNYGQNYGQKSDLSNVERSEFRESYTSQSTRKRVQWMFATILLTLMIILAVALALILPSKLHPTIYISFTNERSSADSCVSQRFMIKTETKGISKRLIIYVLLANCQCASAIFPPLREINCSG